ncbi:MAG: cytidylate kinase-like family protein [Clostridia bacterium]|jgi:cytidylate kinase|nr:cytidylate kinase-like family protein [Clostridia bacterium]MBR3272235.1 cytidylate kinase-like family protein [Clostridia bacterium]
MAYKIVTISRQFGSGGRSIGKKVAEALGYDYYDKELVKQVSMATGFAPEYIEEKGEYAQSRSRLSYLFTTVGTAGVMNGMSAADYLYTMQRKVILDIAEKGNCVIVGRCADYILREREDALHVFIHAPVPYRAERIVRLYGVSEQSPEKRLADKDGKRRINYEHFTGRTWGAADNYAISLNTEAIGEDNCVRLLTEIVKHS